MEEATKRNGKGVWVREIENVLKRFDSSIEWLIERISLRDAKLEVIKQNLETDEHEKNETLRVRRTQCIADVLEEIEVLNDTYFLNEFSETLLSRFLMSFGGPEYD